MESPYLFGRHYTRQEARELLPQIQAWLASLRQLSKQLQKASDKVEKLMADSLDHGGPVVEQYLKTQSQLMQILGEFQERQILVKDLERGLVDFPAIIAGREVFLCWEQGEDDIEFWHDLDAGYAGRERL